MNNNIKQSVPPVATPTELGLYESDSAQYKVLEVGISKVGTVNVDYGLVFDTGSGGMVLDANGILPPSMITSNGFNFSGDSTVVDGVTITSQTMTLQYGADSATLTNVYGNLAYANVTVGDQSGSFVIQRLPFFMYYKAAEGNGTTLPAHYFDTFGIVDEYDEFPNYAYITSPFTSYDPGNSLTKGFKLAQLNSSNFSYDGTYVPAACTIGLTAADLSSSSGFNMNTLTYYAGDGYDPFLQSLITFGTGSFDSYVLFDTGTSGYSYLEDPNWTGNTSQLPLNSAVSLATYSGFNYGYTVQTINNLTYIENPNTSGGEFSDISIEFFSDE
jgi:hypothetical protein